MATWNNAYYFKNKLIILYLICNYNLNFNIIHEDDC